MKTLRAFLLVFMLATAHGFAADAKATDNVAKAQEARARGDFAGSLPFWRAAAAAYAADKDTSGQLSAALGLADAFQQLGQYRLAEDTLEKADQVAKKGGDKRLQVRVESSLGAVYMLTSNPDDAEGLLTKSLALARDVGDAHLIAT
jgi:tetratricopeptide (TPR) repeat protein